MSIALDLRNEANTLTLLTDALTAEPSDLDREHRDDLVEFFERYAETHFDKSWIDVNTLVSLILDNQELAALIRPESIRTVTPRKEQ